MISLFSLFCLKRLTLNINAAVVMFLKYVYNIGNTVDEPEQQQYFTLTFIYILNVRRLVLFAVLF